MWRITWLFFKSPPPKDPPIKKLDSFSRHSGIIFVSCEHFLVFYIRRPGDETDAESSRETSSGGNSDCEVVDRRTKSVLDGSWSQHNLANSNSQQLNRVSLSDKSLANSSSDEAEISSTSPGVLMFEYLEHEQPHNRQPLTDKASYLLLDWKFSVRLTMYPLFFSSERDACGTSPSLTPTGFSSCI